MSIKAFQDHESSREELNRAERPIHTERDVRIVCIGAGLAGLCLAYKLQRSFKKFDLLILEKNNCLGGVWSENQYPGVACDIPGHNYAYSFEPAVDHTAEYASGSEVRQYLQNFANKYGLEDYCLFNTKVRSASWDDHAGHWKIFMEDLKSNEPREETADIIINASGPLNQWKLPDIPGLEDYNGHLMHTANWEKRVELDGKRVAVIGNGSSGQQVLVAIQPRVKKLVHFVRQANWITGPFGEAPRKFSLEEIAEFRDCPEKLLLKRKKVEGIINSTFSSFLSDSPLQAGMRMILTEAMETKIKKGGLNHSLIPKFAPGCRRPTPGIGYLESLCQPNTDIIIGDIKRITEHGVVDHKAVEHQVDVIICATGFDTSFVPSFRLTGLHGQTLHEMWADDVTDSYFATTVPSMPNYAVFAGPFNSTVSGSYVRNIEIQADYMLQLIDRYQTENIHSFAPRQSASRAFTSHCRKYLERTVWMEGCRSHFKADKYNTRLTMWPGSSLHFSDALRELRAEDYEWVYSGHDQFAWLGNGLSATGNDPWSDLSWYVSQQDAGPWMSRRARREQLTRIGAQEGRNDVLKSQGRSAD